MKSKLAAAQNEVREYQCDLYDCFDLIAATSLTVHLDQKLPEVIEDLIHTKTKLQRTSNRLRSTPPDEPDGTRQERTTPAVEKVVGQTRERGVV